MTSPKVTKVASLRSNEQADARSYRFANYLGQGIDDSLPNARGSQQDEKNSLNQHSRQCKLPGITHRQANRIGKESVQPHARRQRKGQFGIKSHNQCRKHGGNDRRREQRVTVHARRAQHIGIDGQDIGHGQESGQTGYYLPADSHRPRIKIEKSIRISWKQK